MMNDEPQTIRLELDAQKLEGELTIPLNPRGLVLFAHGSGSGCHSPRNQYVARVLHSSRIGTLLLDLLTEEEDLDYETRFDIALLSRRLIAATGWIRSRIRDQAFPVGYFGASTGAAAALTAAAWFGDQIACIVSRGGRPDLAGTSLSRVRSPTLLIVGSLDEPVLTLNRQAYEALQTEKELLIISRATHLFEEPGTLEQVAHAARDWFKRYLPPDYQKAEDQAHDIL